MARLRVLLGIMMLVVAAAGGAQTVRPLHTGPVTIGDLEHLLGPELFFKIFEVEFDKDFCLHLRITYLRDAETVSRHAKGYCNIAGPYRLQISLPKLRGHYGIGFGLHHLVHGIASHGVSGGYDLGSPGGHGYTSETPVLELGAYRKLLELDISEVDPDAPVRKELHLHRFELDLRLENNPTGLKGTAPALPASPTTED